MKQEQINWFFDLDKTLYPSNNGLYQEGNRRINEFFKTNLNKTLKEVNKLRLYFMHKYGTSLLGSIKECNFDAKEFLDYVHIFPKEPFLKKEPALRYFLNTLPGKKYIFSNAPKSYINEILYHLGIDGIFSQIYGIESFKYIGKPNKSSYAQILRWTNSLPSKSVLIDDMKINCLSAEKFGLNSIWIDENLTYNSYYEDILFTTITSFLENQL
ncbi:MAG: HAD-IA family hydrolase [Caldisericia bacterium]|nr:HAD-IA family hydrolase [Caldisericia bacterium]